MPRVRGAASGYLEPRREVCKFINLRWCLNGARKPRTSQFIIEFTVRLNVLQPSRLTSRAGQGPVRHQPDHIFCFG